jgi:hypothetical protein
MAASAPLTRSLDWLFVHLFACRFELGTVDQDSIGVVGRGCQILGQTVELVTPVKDPQ